MRAATGFCSTAPGEVKMIKKIAISGIKAIAIKAIASSIPLSLALLASVAWAQVDLNKANEIELDGLKGLGPAMTRQIMDTRQKAPFRDWPDVMQRVKGIGPKKAASLSEQGIRVQGQTFGQALNASPKKP
jgi:competence protein ComEA